MRYHKSLILSVVFLTVVVAADAQRRPRSQRGGSTQRPDTTRQQQNVQQNTNPAAVSGYNPYANVPIEMAPQVGGFNDTIKPSLRRDAAVDKNNFKERIPLDYEYLRADDALYTQRVWREIDIREKINLPFRYQAQDDNGDQRFVSILVKAVRDQLRGGNAIAFDANDDRFTTFLDSTAFERAIGAGFEDILEANNTGAEWREASTIVQKCRPGSFVTIEDIYAVGPDGTRRKLPPLIYYLK